MIRRSPEWFDRQLAHCNDVLALLDRHPTPEEIAAAEAFLRHAPDAPQAALFTAPPHAGVMPSGQPEPSGLAASGHLGDWDTKHA